LSAKAGSVKHHNERASGNRFAFRISISSISAISVSSGMEKRFEPGAASGPRGSEARERRRAKTRAPERGLARRSSGAGPGHPPPADPK